MTFVADVKEALEGSGYFVRSKLDNRVDADGDVQCAVHYLGHLVDPSQSTAQSRVRLFVEAYRYTAEQFEALSLAILTALDPVPILIDRLTLNPGERGWNYLIFELRSANADNF